MMGIQSFNEETRKTAGTPAVQDHEFLVGWFEQFANQCGLPCICFHRGTYEIVARSHDDSLPIIPIELLQRSAAIRGSEIIAINNNLLCFLTTAPFNETYLIGGFARSSDSINQSELESTALAAGWTRDRFELWLQTVPVCEQRILDKLLHCAIQTVEQHRREIHLQLEFNAVRQEIGYTCDQLNLLHSLTQNLNLSRPTEELAAQCLDKLQTLIDCSGSLIWLQNRMQPHDFQTRGELPFDQTGLIRLLKRFQQHDWTKPLVRNRLQDTLLGAVFPGLRNLVIAPIGDETHHHGWILTCNLSGSRDFGGVESSLVWSIATILGTHAHNIQLFEQHDDLLLSFVRSLVSSLDAKDAYTRGHSERVALIARRLGMHLQLPQTELDDLYLSSLLHDLGKIGVDDEILSKTGKLTTEEFRQIQQHPIIGFEILSPVKSLSRILPGVRNHHEAYNGKGYPDGLRGEDIPLMARIIAVADSYDAMASDRPYRDGMPIPILEDIFRRGSGEQWDPKVIEAYFAVRDEILSLSQSYSLEVGAFLDCLNVSQSGVFQYRNLEQPVTV